MAATPKRVTLLSSSSSYSSSKKSNIADFLQPFYTSIENLSESHKQQIESLNNKIVDLENENKHLRSVYDQHPHSIFDINYVSSDQLVIDQLKSELEKSQKQITALQDTLNEKCTECDDAKSKYHVQLIMNQNNSEQQNSSADITKMKELELKLKQIKDQVNQFDQCYYENDEQIRLLKQILSSNDQEQSRAITQSLTVKQSDLAQQTDFVENLLNKQHDVILNKIVQLLDQNPRNDQQVTAKNKKTTKKKRL
ncbi:unnamed protein product [Adineta steineri]|uniref:Uncharacterized protein n=1 Tax=Adineta steineri TaxID=433720 RepID=A0A813Y7K8_9BILA|nr:unnamed protein product [Adineta steineri]